MDTAGSDDYCMRIVDDLERSTPRHGTHWCRRRHSRRPFISLEFLHALHDSGCASADTGWEPHYLTSGTRRPPVCRPYRCIASITLTASTSSTGPGQMLMRAMGSTITRSGWSPCRSHRYLARDCSPRPRGEAPGGTRADRAYRRVRADVAACAVCDRGRGDELPGARRADAASRCSSIGSIATTRPSTTIWRSSLSRSARRFGPNAAKSQTPASAVRRRDWQRDH